MLDKRVFDSNLAIAEDVPGTVRIPLDEYEGLLAQAAELNKLLSIAFRAIESEDPLESYNALNDFMVTYWPVYTSATLIDKWGVE